jgi:teichuronic acid biosynthesis glycosyltransferase TuaG
MNPLVSIIMPCLNAKNTINEAIKSILSQDYINIELIVVDDGSTDGSIIIIERIQSNDARVKLFRNIGVHGVSFARNMGLDAASGKYICFLDSDDYLLPGSITVRVKKMEEKNVKIVYGSYLRLVPGGELLRKKVPYRVTLSQMLRKNYIGNLTGMYDAESLGKVRQLCIKHEDYLMWCQLLRIEKYAYSTGAEPIAVYRVSPNSLSGNKFKAFIWHWIVLRRGLGVGLFSSFSYQLFYMLSSLFERISHAFQRKLK